MSKIELQVPETPINMMTATKLAVASGRFSASTSRSGFYTTGQAGKLPIQVENTYRTEPVVIFPSAEVRNVVKTTLEVMLADKNYSPEESKKLTEEIANNVKAKVKRLNTKRYKLVVFVTVGPATTASIAFASRCVWNEKQDTFVEQSHNNGSIFATVLVYGVHAD
jgi:D-alanyl-D-alanine dipeptidase